MSETDPAGGVVFDPAGLTSAQCAGAACLVCRKSWPRPGVRVGTLPDASPVYACDDCAPGLLRAVGDARTAPAEAGADPGGADGSRHTVPVRRRRVRWLIRR